MRRPRFCAHARPFGIRYLETVRFLIITAKRETIHRHRSTLEVPVYSGYGPRQHVDERVERSLRLQMLISHGDGTRRRPPCLDLLLEAVLLLRRRGCGTFPRLAERRGREERNAGAAQQSGSQSARAAYSRKDPRRVVRISPRAKKTYNTWKKFEKMYQDDRDNNVNPLFMSSMGQYEDMWAREMAQARASKSEHVDQKKPWVVTPHHAAVAKRARMQAQTSVTARGPYIPPHEAHRRFFFDRRKWLHGAWHIPAPSGSFTMRGSAFAAASAVTKGQRHADDRHIERHATTSRKPLHGGHQ